MRERPILFSAPMVRAILDGRKTVTRRLVKPNPHKVDGGVPFADAPAWAHAEPGSAVMRCPYGVRGDRLWVRETHYLHGIWSVRKDADAKRRWTFHATQDMGVQFEQPNGLIRGRSTTVPGWYRRPSIHMPRWASRITLEITSVRVERLQEISIEDAKAEGAWGPDDSIVQKVADYFGTDIFSANPRKAFQMLWESINGPDSWAANPWVWAIEFRRVP